MNETSPSLSELPEPPNRKRKAAEMWIGCAVGLAPGILALILRNDSVIALFFLTITVWPLASIILAVIPSTRRFGLGMLLGLGFTYMVLLAVCGGMTLGIGR
jgi:hypothetical protein